MFDDDLRRSLFDTIAEPEFDRLTALLASVLDVPVTLLSFLDERRAYFKSAQGIAERLDGTRDVPLTHSLCRQVVKEGVELVIGNARADPVCCAHAAVTELGVGSYLGYPVRGPDGIVLGSLCAIGTEARDWSARDRQVIAALAQSIETEIGLRSALARQNCMLAELRAAHGAIDAARDVDRELDERTRFFTSLSHEIRTPLNGLLGGVSLLEVASDDAGRAEYTALIHSSADGLLRFIEDLVDFARDSSGRGTASVRDFDPRAPLEAARRALAPAAAEKGLVLRVEIDAAAPEHWTGDASRIERLLLTLLGNAMQYTDAGEVRLGLRPEGGRLAYSVEDTGPGIPHVFRERIFEPFDRGDPALSQRVNGTGLGLAMARRSARLIGADLWLARSEPGVGSRFCFAVPRS